MILRQQQRVKNIVQVKILKNVSSSNSMPKTANAHYLKKMKRMKI